MDKEDVKEVMKQVFALAAVVYEIAAKKSSNKSNAAVDK